MSSKRVASYPTELKQVSAVLNTEISEKCARILQFRPTAAFLTVSRIYSYVSICMRNK